jgi:two-component system response regulator NreC
VIRIVIVDDHPVARAGIKSFLSGQPDMQVIGEAEEGLEGLRTIAQLQPDVVVLDLSLPTISGLDVARSLKERHSQARVVVLSAHVDESYVLQALRTGVCAYVAKDGISLDLARAIRSAASGRRFLSPSLADRAIEVYLEYHQEPTTDPLESFSSREREVFQLLAKGNSTKEAAAILSLSPRTVETYRATLLRKLSLENQAELVRFAVEKGLIP